MALQTKIAPPGWHAADETWKWAVENGHWTRVNGCEMLRLGGADYVLADEGGGHVPGRRMNTHEAIIYSVNSDPSNEWNKLPFGIRWSIDKDDIERGRGGTSLDALAIEQFRLKGLIP